jgi:hypothetical protein
MAYWRYWRSIMMVRARELGAPVAVEGGGFFSSSRSVAAFAMQL